MSSLTSINLKIDSCATNHSHEIGSTNPTQKPTSNYNLEARVIVHNGSSMVSPTTTNILIISLPQSATKYHGFNHLESGYLFSVRKTYDHNFTAGFDKNYVKIFRSTEVSINAIRPTIIQGHRNEPS